MADATQPSESKALRLARYLKEFVGLRATTVYDVSSYESVLWFGDLPREPECQSPAWSPAGEPADHWLTVHKPQLPPLPAPPEVILPWIDQRALSRAADEMPRLQSVRLESSGGVDKSAEAPAERRLENHPEVAQAYERYRPEWENWSREHRRRSLIQSVYAQLFRMHTQVQKQGEIFELVLGFGLLAWRRPNGDASPPILRHMVTAQVDLHFDAATGTIRLYCGPDGAQLKIEDGMLDAGSRPARVHYAAVTEQLNALGDDVWNRNIVIALKSWAAALHPDSEWSPELKMAASGENKPILSFAPALILRKRAQAGMLRIYDSLIEQLSKEGEPPCGWQGLVDVEAGQDNGDAASSSLSASQEIYFPLPANREQRRIVDVIDRHRGVLVQGPPGTGKSHTIANLVCHLLASGKRVLITAETGRALKVLKEKLPEEMRPLCVSLLGQGGDAFAELNSAVQGITTRFSSWHEGAYDERIADVDRELDAQRKMLAEIDGGLRSLREEETRSHSLMNGSYKGSASEIAVAVAAERDRFGWIQLPQGAGERPPVSGADMVKWLRVRRDYDADAAAAVKFRFVDANELPSPADFAAAIATENEVKAAFDGMAGVRAHPAYAAIATLTEEDRAALAARLRELRDSREALQRRGDGWLQSALQAALEGRQAGWQALVEQSVQVVSDIDLLMQRLGAHAVSIPEGWDLKQIRADLVAVYRHLREGGKWVEFGLYTPKAIRGRAYLRDQITINGHVADTPDRLRIVCDHIDLMLALQALDLAWSDYGGLPPGSQPRIRMAAIREHVSIFAAALDYAQACLHLGRILTATTPAIPEPDWLNGEADVFLDMVTAAALEDRYRAALDQITARLSELKAMRDVPGVHPVVGAVVDAIETRDAAAYGHAYLHVQRLAEAVRDLELARTVEAAFAPAVPGLAEAVAGSLDDPAWDDRFAAWERAWRWAVADNWLTRRADAVHRERLWQRRQETDDEIRRLLTEAAALRAWTNFFSRLSAPEAAALRAWREAVRAMGKETGRSARIERLRQEARQYMDRCRDAIPVWIMPRYLIAEMLAPEPGRYDLVIVDEASQLSIDSLFLFYISKKMIVVGDDQQISPYGAGISDQSIAGLQRRYLDGIPFHNAFSAQSSLYGNAKIRFGQSVVLREHFRCMPEIIQFSNNLCYESSGTPLDPLRTYPIERLKPLVTRHVTNIRRTDGEDGESPLNEAEADAILAQIKACIADPRYAGRTMGVISLQGEAQTRLIEHKLLEALEPEIFEQRRLMCGDAYAFQGDERHIIFLSMVAAPGAAGIAPLATDQARQQFNVAASRARDQLWLFHSMTLDDVSEACMRHRLLSYMLNPRRPAPEEVRQRFEFDFEREVFRAIVDRGFHVRTQVCIGNPNSHRYRVDLVVEGAQGRLAVECDGDHWQGPERYEEDMVRQRDLERVGWQFVRIRGSAFHRDRDQALAPLWTELDRLGIRPGGVDDGAVEPPSANADGLMLEFEEEFEEAGRVHAQGRADQESTPSDSGREPAEHAAAIPEGGREATAASALLDSAGADGKPVRSEVTPALHPEDSGAVAAVSLVEATDSEQASDAGTEAPAHPALPEDDRRDGDAAIDEAAAATSRRSEDFEPSSYADDRLWISAEAAPGAATEELPRPARAEIDLESAVTLRLRRPADSEMAAAGLSGADPEWEEVEEAEFPNADDDDDGQFLSEADPFGVILADSPASGGGAGPDLRVVAQEEQLSRSAPGQNDGGEGEAEFDEAASAGGHRKPLEKAPVLTFGGDPENETEGAGDANVGGADVLVLGKADSAAPILADYVAFSGVAGPDPRTAPLDEVVDGLCRIIEVEGPMIARRALDIYLQGCGIRRLGSELKNTMSKALAVAVAQGLIMSENVTSRGGLILSTVRPKGAPPVIARRIGPRSFEEIPHSELRAVAQRLAEARNLTPGSDEYLQAVAEALELELDQVSAVLVEPEDDLAYADDSAAGSFGQRRA